MPDEKNESTVKHPMTNQIQFFKRTIYPAVHKHKFAWPFHTPVDPVKLQLPDYFDVIKQPMDLSLIKKKMETMQYKSAKEIIADFDLMFNNCYTYNRPTEDVTIMAKRVQEFLHNKVKSMPPVETVIEPKQKKPKKVVPPVLPALPAVHPAAPPVTQGIPPRLVDVEPNKSRSDCFNLLLVHRVRQILQPLHLRLLLQHCRQRLVCHNYTLHQVRLLLPNDLCDKIRSEDRNLN